MHAKGYNFTRKYLQCDAAKISSVERTKLFPRVGKVAYVERTSAAEISIRPDPDAMGCTKSSNIKLSPREHTITLSPPAQIGNIRTAIPQSHSRDNPRVHQSWRYLFSNSRIVEAMLADSKKNIMLHYLLYTKAGPRAAATTASPLLEPKSSPGWGTKSPGGHAGLHSFLFSFS